MANAPSLHIIVALYLLLIKTDSCNFLFSLSVFSIFDFCSYIMQRRTNKNRKYSVKIRTCKSVRIYKITKIDLLSRSSISFLILDMAGVGLSQESASLFFQAVLFLILMFYIKNIDFKYDS